MRVSIYLCKPGLCSGSIRPGCFVDLRDPLSVTHLAKVVTLMILTPAHHKMLAKVQWLPGTSTAVQRGSKTWQKYSRYSGHERTTFLGKRCRPLASRGFHLEPLQSCPFIAYFHVSLVQPCQATALDLPCCKLSNYSAHP